MSKIFKKLATYGILAMLMSVAVMPVVSADFADQINNVGQTTSYSSSDDSSVQNVAAEYNGTIKYCGAEDISEEPFSYNQFIEENVTLDNFEVATARIVELSEPLPGTTVSSGDAVLINAYKGTCCTKYKGNQCINSANVYYNSSSECESAFNTRCSPVQIMVSTTGIGLLKFYVLQLYIWAASVVGIVAVLVIVFSGIQIAASAGEDQVGNARTRIVQSLAGIAILFLSALILYTINPTFFIR